MGFYISKKVGPFGYSKSLSGGPSGPAPRVTTNEDVGDLLKLVGVWVVWSGLGTLIGWLLIDVLGWVEGHNGAAAGLVLSSLALAAILAVSVVVAGIVAGVRDGLRR